jgi:phage baseplate assembly protein W
MLSLYRGFSLHEFRQKQTTKLTDLDLVKLNLLTHLYTSKGERLMMSNFGTRIPDLIYEALTEDAVEIVRQDIIDVCSYDPRIELVDLVVQPIWDESAIVAHLKIKYKELNLAGSIPLRIEFDNA